MPIVMDTFGLKTIANYLENNDACSVSALYVLQCKLVQFKKYT